MRTPWNEVFKPDSGIVFEMRGYGITAKDYDVLLPLLIPRYPAVYSEDGETSACPDFSTITRRRNLVTTMLELNIVGVQVRCWFAEDDEIDLDLLPDDVDTKEKAEGIFGLMSMIAKTLKRRIFLTAENAGATQRWSEEHAICVFDPPTQM